MSRQQKSNCPVPRLLSYSQGKRMRHISRRRTFLARQHKSQNAMLETAWITGLLVAMVIASPFWLQALERLGLYRFSPPEFGFMFGSVMIVVLVLIGLILKQRWDDAQK